MTSRVLVAGIGNVFLTDDGFGPAVAERLLAGAGTGQPLSPGTRVVDYGIRGMHLAYDLLDEWDALVLVDALPDRGEPGRVVVLEISAGDVEGGQLDAHGMDPATVLANLRTLGGELPARTVVVGCQVADAEEGMGLTPVVARAVDEAVRTVRSLVTRDLAATEVG